MTIKKIPIALIFICGLMHLGTTYVIKEGGKEVGRYDVNDGKSDIVAEDNARPRPAAPKPKGTPKVPPAPAVTPQKNPQAEARENIRKQINEIAQEAKARTDEMKQQAQTEEYAKKNGLLYIR